MAGSISKTCLTLLPREERTEFGGCSKNKLHQKALTRALRKIVLQSLFVGLTNNSQARCLARKLHVRALKRSKGKQLFDLDKTVIKNMEDRLKNVKGQDIEEMDDTEEEIVDKKTPTPQSFCVRQIVV